MPVLHTLFDQLPTLTLPGHVSAWPRPSVPGDQRGIKGQLQKTSVQHVAVMSCPARVIFIHDPIRSHVPRGSASFAIKINRRMNDWLQ